jgi:hypothetical protein
VEGPSEPLHIYPPYNDKDQRNRDLFLKKKNIIVRMALPGAVRSKWPPVSYLPCLLAYPSVLSAAVASEETAERISQISGDLFDSPFLRLRLSVD